MSKIIINTDDLVGRKYNQLVVISAERKISKQGKSVIFCYCLCDCGEYTHVAYNNLIRNHTQSCGHFRREMIYKSTKKYNEYSINEDIATIYYRGFEITLDANDFDTVNKYYWGISFYGYAVSDGNNLYMHRLILGITDESVLIDHIDRNPLNNKRSNLRVCTRVENNRNAKLRTNNKSGITGVGWNNKLSSWYADIRLMRKTIHLGSFKNKDDAIKKRLLAEKEYFGEFAPQKHLYELYGIENE